MINYGIPTYPQPMNNTNAMISSLDKQIENQEGRLNELKQMKNQIMQPQQPSINQTFQLAPNNSGIRYAETMEDVNKEMIYMDTPFFSKDMSVVWIKSIKGDIKSYSLTEIIQKDEKDLLIESLQMQIKEMKGMINNDNSNNDNVNEPIENNKSSKSKSDSKHDK